MYKSLEYNTELAIRIDPQNPIITYTTTTALYGFTTLFTLPQ